MYRAPALLALIALIAALYLARAFFIPLLIGILASYALCPAVDWLVKCRVPRAAAAALVLAAVVGGFSWIAFSLSDDAAAMVEKLPEAARKLRQELSAARAGGPTPLQNMQAAANELEGAAADAAGGGKPHPLPIAARKATLAAPAPAPATWMSDYMLAQSGLLMTVAAQAPIVLLLAFFLLAAGEHFRRKLVQLVGPSLAAKKDAVRMLEEIDTQIQRYLFSTVLSNALVAAGTWLAFEALGVGQAPVWGVAAGVLHFIPYLGPVAIALASGLAAYLQFGSLLSAAAVAGASLAVAGAAGLLFTTWLQSRFASVNAAVLFIALLFFGWLWGIWGLLLGAPLVAIAKVVCDRVESLHPVGALLGR
ncbi:MAG: AI-2E family transporter [Betaproteobacteria bacterium]|nr:MAG: AI-2E family transporter [Betaproteobacteria bacterium]